MGTNNLSILDASSVVGPTEILALWYNNPNRYSGNLNFMSFGDGTGADETVRYALTSVNASYIVDSGTSIPDSGATTVPAPGALLLASMGAGLVGYIQRRRGS